MNHIKSVLLIWSIVGVIIFTINDYVYYDLPVNPNNKPFLEHIIIGWLIFITTALTLILFYKEKKK
jgi:ABC-type glucose/galactose transport system permease subunit